MAYLGLDFREPPIKLPAVYDQLTPEQRKRVRETYAKKQKGRCYHCKQPLEHKPPERITKLPLIRVTYPPDFFKWPVHLHHNHETGLTIGAVHAYCNAVLYEYHGE